MYIGSAYSHTHVWAYTLCRHILTDILALDPYTRHRGSGGQELQDVQMIASSIDCSVRLTSTIEGFTSLQNRSHNYDLCDNIV